MSAKAPCHNGAGFWDVSQSIANGHGLRSPAECQAACRERADCKYFTFNKNSKACWLLGAGATFNPWIPGMESGDVDCEVTDVRKCEVGKAYHDPGVMPFKAEEAKLCRQRCRDTNCTYFTYNVISKDCWPIDSPTAHFLGWMPGAVSGRPHCELPIWLDWCKKDSGYSDATAPLPVKKIHAQDCQYSCREQKKCYFFTYNKLTKDCWFLGPHPVLHNWLDQVVSGPSYCSVPPPNLPCRSTGSWYDPAIPMPNGNGPGVVDGHDCRSACRKKTDCVYFTFDQVSRGCWLLARNAYLNLATKFTTSGPKECHLPSKSAPCHEDSGYVDHGDLVPKFRGMANASECWRACNTSAECYAFTFNKVTRECWLMGPKVLFHSWMAGVVSGTKECILPANNQCREDAGYSDPDVPMNNFGALDSSACQKACQAQPSCAYFTFNDVLQKCWLLGKSARFSGAVAGVISGPKNCTLFQNQTSQSLVFFRAVGRSVKRFFAPKGSLLSTVLDANFATEMMAENEAKNCEPGGYTTWGTACHRCVGGDVRRRRGFTKCTGCDVGRFNAGNKDECSPSGEVLQYALSEAMGMTSPEEWMISLVVRLRELGIDIAAPLRDVALGDNVAAVKILAAAGVDVVGVEPPLLFAAVKGRAHRVARWLLQNDSVVVDARDAEGRTSLYRSAFAADFEMCKLLVAAGATPGNISEAAAAADTVNAMQCLKQAGVDLDGKHLIFIAAKGGAPHAVRWVMNELGSSASARDAAGRTPLYYAARVPDFETCKILVDANAPDLQVILHKAAHDDNVGSLRCLDRADVDLFQDTKHPLLLVAARSGALQVVRWLMTHEHIFADETDAVGRTPLFIAASQGNLELCKQLVNKELPVSKRANVERKSHYGATPLDAADRSPAVRAYLEHYRRNLLSLLRLPSTWIVVACSTVCSAAFTLVSVGTRRRCCRRRRQRRDYDSSGGSSKDGDESSSMDGCSSSETASDSEGESGEDHGKFKTDCGSEHGGRGGGRRAICIDAKMLAAEACAVSWRRKGAMLYRFLGVVAQMIYPFGLCASYVHPYLWFPLVAALLILPALHTLGWRRFSQRPVLMFGLWGHNLLNIHPRESACVGDSIIAIVRTLVLLPLAMWLGGGHSPSEYQAAAAEAWVVTFPWYMFCGWLNALVSPHSLQLENPKLMEFGSGYWNSTHWNPMHTSTSAILTLPQPFTALWQTRFPMLRAWVVWDACVGLVTLLWCVVTLITLVLPAGDELPVLKLAAYIEATESADELRELGPDNESLPDDVRAAMKRPVCPRSAVSTYIAIANVLAGLYLGLTVVTSALLNDDFVFAFLKLFLYLATTFVECGTGVLCNLKRDGQLTVERGFAAPGLVNVLQTEAFEASFSMGVVAYGAMFAFTTPRKFILGMLALLQGSFSVANYLVANRDVAF